MKLMRSIANIFALDMFKLWGLSNPDATVFGAVLRVVGLALSDAQACKGSDFKIEIFRVLTAASGRYGQRDNVLQTCVHAICRNEHVPLVIAELCLYAQDVGSDANLAAAAFRDITKLDDAELARDTAMSRNAGIFLMEAADRLPNVALMSLSLLLPILEYEAYSMRCAVVHTLARVLVSAVGHSSSEEATRVRESLLAVLLERCLDVNAFVRARVLQAWVLLAEKKCIPVRRVPAVVSQAVERCKDKTAAVRRSALLLLQALLQFNPYAQILPLNVFTAKAKEAKSLFEACSAANSSHRDSDASAGEAEDAPKASARARMVFYDAAVEFIQQLHTAIAIAIELLGSKNTSDISEAVEFIVGCHAYGVDAAAKGVCGLTMLVFSKEEAIKCCARSSVVRLFIEPLKSKMMTKEDCRIIIQRMAALAAQCTLGELTSLDATFLDASNAEKGLPKEMLDTIWEWISSPQTSELPVWTLLGCYRLLPIFARAVPSQFQSRIDGLVTICGADSQACALAAAQSLLQLAHQNGMPRAKTIAVCDILIQVVLREVSGAALDAWFPFAEAACQAIWVLHPRPEALFASAIRSLLATSLGQKKKEGTSASSGRLSQLFFLTGQSAVRAVIRVEHAGKSRAKIADAKENAKHGISSGEADKDDALCKDLGLVPEQARQTEAESARDSAESDLADPENLIAMVSSMASRVAMNTNGKYADATLRCAAGQCIGLCSATSAKLAEQNIQLLTSILARATESRLRANAAIALGDIAGRFPNTFEPWASHMFNALRDQVYTPTPLPSPTPAVFFTHSCRANSGCFQILGVRKTVLLVLTHLILNDMVKSRGFLSEISLKLLDVDSEVQASARLFFCEFANKQNGAALYNAIPDVISRLGTDVSEPDFQKIMKFLMSFMDKERLAENLGDRLVLRLASATDGRSARDVSFCLNQIPCSEKVLKRLVEQWKTIASRCSDDLVLSNLKGVCAKAKKPAKVDKEAASKDGETAAVVSKNSLELLERRLAKAEAGELWNSDDDEGGPSSSATAEAAKGKKKPATKGALKVSSKGNKTPSKTPVKGRGKKAKDSSDEDEDSVSALTR